MPVRKTVKSAGKGQAVILTDASHSPEKALNRETPGLRPVHELSGMEKIRKVRQGMTKQDLEAVKESFGLDYETLARILSVAKATLFNKKGSERFNAGLSEKIFALADLYSYGLSVFQDKIVFNNWMEQPNRALGYTRPVELLDTLIGVGEVKNLVGRIEYGVYS